MPNIESSLVEFYDWYRPTVVHRVCAPSVSQFTALLQKVWIVAIWETYSKDTKGSGGGFCGYGPHEHTLFLFRCIDKRVNYAILIEIRIDVVCTKLFCNFIPRSDARES